MPPTIHMALACAYCGERVAFRQADIILKTRGGKFTTLKCDHCDSVFDLYVSSKRVRKGKRLKHKEANDHAAYRLSLAARRTEVYEAGEGLLAEPGCTCEERIKVYDGWTRGEDGKWLPNPHSYQDNGGHPLSSSWSSNKEAGGMLPNMPHHRARCPANHEET
jgi:hypothetical protein